MHSQPEDPIIRRLYVLAIQQNASMSQYEENYRKILRAICRSDLIRDVPDSQQVIKRLENIIDYNNALKRRYSLVEQDSATSQQLEMPEHLPLETPYTATEVLAKVEQQEHDHVKYILL